MNLESLWTTLDERLLPVLQSYRERLPTLEVSEKADKTLLSEADLAAQRLIVDTILEAFPESGFVAEEDDEPIPRQGNPVWVIDPIDGTSEFVSATGREFCSVVCRLDDGVPTAAYVLAPELGDGRQPIRIHWAAHVTVNDEPAKPLPARSKPVRASVTRSKGSQPRSFEAELTRAGCDMKLRTTSQTLDMVRACVDLSPWTGAPDQQFDFFYRPNQKVWDGLAGMAFAMAMGRIARDGSGRDPVPVSPELLAEREPQFSETIAGDPDCVRWFLSRLR